MTTNLLPSLARVRVSRGAADGPGVWLPVILLWPLWFMALGLFYITLLAITAATDTHAYHAVFAATRALHQVACGLRGVRCDVQSPHAHFSLVLL
jgi:hypothetical protein